MNWKIKAYIQKIVAFLPENYSNILYYKIQKILGSFKNYNSEKRINAGFEIIKILETHKTSLTNKVVFEIGTGRVPVIPIVLWLSGVKKIITIDLNNYLKLELLRTAIKQIINNAEIIKRFNNERYKKLTNLLDCDNRKMLLNELNIIYLAPADASNSNIMSDTVDIIFSYTVLEHIDINAIKKILTENKRILKKSGKAIHYIDYSDHFSHSDNSINSINFLQFSQNNWDYYSNNQFMYMNRIRHNEYVKIFEEINFKLQYIKTDVDNNVIQLLQSNKLYLDEKFKKFDNETLSTVGSWFLLYK